MKKIMSNSMENEIKRLITTIKITNSSDPSQTQKAEFVSEECGHSRRGIKNTCVGFHDWVEFCKDCKIVTRIDYRNK